MNLRSKVERLERYAAGGDPCPACGNTEGLPHTFEIVLEPADAPAEPEYCGECRRCLTVDIGGDLNAGG